MYSQHGGHTASEVSIAHTIAKPENDEKKIREGSKL
jgi:hypothetical protein